MLHSRHIVVADFTEKTLTVYQGPDITAANKAMAAEVAKGEAEAVLLFSHPMPTSVRYPLQDKAAIQARADEAKLAEKAAADQEAAELQGKRDQVKALQAEIKKLSA
jgi:hypothetical protein